MELAIKNNLSDITYLSELTPTPIGLTTFVFSQLVWGLNSQTLATVKNIGSYDLCRSFQSSINHLLI